MAVQERRASAQEATELLQDLLRVDTVNPPGNETLAAELLVEYLARERHRERAHRARARPRQPRRADPGRRWPVARVPEPYGHRSRRSGGVGAGSLVRRPRRRRDLGARCARHEGTGGCVRGRLRVARARRLRPVGRPDLHGSWSPTRRSETGTGSAGSSRRIRMRRAATTPSTRAAATGSCSAAARSTCVRRPRRCRRRSSLRVHGRSGHASMPGIADNALVKAARYVTALAAYDPPMELIPEARGFLEAVLDEVPPLEEAIAPRERAAPDARRARSATSLAHALTDHDRSLQASGT